MDLAVPVASPCRPGGRFGASVERKRRPGYIAGMSDSGLEVSAAPARGAADAALLPILIAPHATLKARARAVTDADADAVRALLPRMFATMYHAPGIGLAAPQVAVGLRVIVVDVGGTEAPAPMALVNPELAAVSKELATREEGCLSLPNQYADVTRPARVSVRYLDAEGARREVQADGLLAACLQHEIDHLDGVLFVDHLSVLKRNMILRRLAKEQRQKER